MAVTNTVRDVNTVYLCFSPGGHPLLGTRGTTVPDPKYTIRSYEFAIGTAVQKLILDDIPPEHAALIAQTLYDYR